MTYYIILKIGDVKKNTAVPFKKGSSCVTLVEKTDRYPKDSGTFIKSTKESSEEKTHKVKFNIFPKLYREYYWT